MSSYYTSNYVDLIKYLDLKDEIVCDIGGSGELINIIKKILS